MPGPYCSSAQLLQYGSDVVQVPIGNLPVLWTRQAGNAVTLGWVNLASKMATFAYSATFLDGSDQAMPWNLSQSLYELAGLGGGFGDYKREWFDRFNVCDRMTKEEFAVLTIQGVPQAVGANASAVGGANFGQVCAVTEIRRRNRHGWGNWRW